MVGVEVGCEVTVVTLGAALWWVFRCSVFHGHFSIGKKSL